MTDHQLYIAIGVPVVFNALIYSLLYASLTARIDAVKEIVQTQLSALREVMDMRLKHLEGQK